MWELTGGSSVHPDEYPIGPMGERGTNSGELMVRVPVGTAIDSHQDDRV